MGSTARVIGENLNDSNSWSEMDRERLARMLSIRERTFNFESGGRRGPLALVNSLGLEVPMAIVRMDTTKSSETERPQR